ncbi:hypothetical protein P154DRAFT_517671 [Amniculicola lignicola CBS 123094]|uniref:Solute carrier family 40 member n=1 Tax=Amniculicola lignicola CBS 123094 TaxID=1392246 RepID=A0A6A5WYC4_9PLEO|nr:hypothetical protein P154DRAFT_517671 [Amniculicola lignicola CBS 123094]
MEETPRSSLDFPLPSETTESVVQDTVTSSAPVLWKLYLSHTLSTWNARTFEFGAIIFLAKIFPGTLFYASCYALFRSGAATLLSSRIGGYVDRTHRLTAVRHSIIWQRIPVAASCLFLMAMLRYSQHRPLVLSFFAASVGLAGIEKLAFIANTVSIERDWVIIVSESLSLDRQELNSTMRRIDLVSKLIAPLCISLVDGYSTKLAIWVVFGLNAISVVFEYFAIAQVFSVIPELGHGKVIPSAFEVGSADEQPYMQFSATDSPTLFNRTLDFLAPWKEYVTNPAFLASFALSILFLTVLSFASQMTTYLLALGFTSIHISVMRLVAVVFELSATCAAPILMRKIGTVRAGLWFVNEQLISLALAVGLYAVVGSQTQLAGIALVVGITLSRLGLWGFDLCVQFLVQEDAPEDSRATFSSIEVSLQNLFELLSFAITIVFHRPEDFKYPVYISVGAVAVGAACFAGFVRQKRGHLLHTSKCLQRKGRTGYDILPTVEEEQEEYPGEGPHNTGAEIQG